MKLNILAVGSKMPSWVDEGYQHFAKRLPRETSLHLHEIAPAKRGKSGSAAQWIEQEGQKILAAIAQDDFVVALDVKGKMWSTEQLAQNMENWQYKGCDIALIIGGPDGLSEPVLARADQRWSLSALTMPHPLVRIVLAEQLYRAWTVLQHHPYHRA